MQKEKEALAEIMLEHGIEWEQKGEHREHLSVLEYKREQRTQELAELEQTIERVQQQQVSIKAVEQIEAKPLPLSSKVALEREDYQALVTAAQKFVVQEKQEGKLKKAPEGGQENHCRTEKHHCRSQSAAGCGYKGTLGV